MQFIHSKSFWTFYCAFYKNILHFLNPNTVSAPVFGRRQFFGTSEHYGIAHGSLLSGWMNYDYTACCWFFTWIQQYFNTSIIVLTNQVLKVADCTVQSAEYWCFYCTALKIKTNNWTTWQILSLYSIVLFMSSNAITHKIFMFENACIKKNIYTHSHNMKNGVVLSFSFNYQYTFKKRTPVHVKYNTSTSIVSRTTCHFSSFNILSHTQYTRVHCRNCRQHNTVNSLICGSVRILFIMLLM